MAAAKVASSKARADVAPFEVSSAGWSVVVMS
jgi:hypothetical protein